MEIQQAKVRETLKPRREPYWRQLERGLYVGYRRMTSRSGTWLARWRDPETGRQHYKPLGSDVGYAEAASEAVRWHQEARQGVVKAETVKAALRAYVADRRQTKGDATAKDADTYFSALIYGEDAPATGRTFGNTRLDKLRVVDVRRFRDNLVASRSKATANRIMRRIKAALSWAHRNQMVASDSAWRHVPMFPAADGQRKVYLTVEQRRAVLAECSPALRDFLTLILFTGARPGEIANLKVEDFNRRDKTLRIVTHKGRDGSPRTRYLDLTDAAAELISHHARLRMKSLPLLVNEYDRPWQKKHWAQGLRQAVLAARRSGARLPSGIVAYSLRHSAITDWLRAGVNVGDAARQAGTSIMMISRTYYQADDTRAIRAGITVI